VRDRETILGRLCHLLRRPVRRGAQNRRVAASYVPREHRKAPPTPRARPAPLDFDPHPSRSARVDVPPPAGYCTSIPPPRLVAKSRLGPEEAWPNRARRCRYCHRAASTWSPCTFADSEDHCRLGEVLASEASARVDGTQTGSRLVSTSIARTARCAACAVPRATSATASPVAGAHTLGFAYEQPAGRQDAADSFSPGTSSTSGRRARPHAAAARVDRNNPGGRAGFATCPLSIRHARSDE